MLSYAYAVGHAGPGLDAAVGPVTGVAGVPLRTVSSGGLAAVVCSVPEAEFSEAGLKEQLEDLDRLEALARSHHAVVDSLATQTTILPLRLATVYLDDERVAGMLADSSTGLRALLDRLRDHVEWGVKVYADPSASASETSASETSASAGQVEEAAESPGRAFLQRRRAQRNTREEAYRAAQEAVQRALAAASSFAVDRVAHRPQQGELAEGEGENIANEAFLVPLSRTEEFRSGVEEAARGLQGVRVEVTGPWAPYSFAAPGGEGSGQ